jgi:hypothetical protein
MKAFSGRCGPDVEAILARRFALRYSTLDYTLHLDPVRRIAYAETPKVACTSIKKYMMDQSFGGTFPLPDKGTVHDRSKSPLSALHDLDARGQLGVFGGGWQRFTFVRNPFTRILSAYLDKLVQNDWERKRLLPGLGFSSNERPCFITFLDRIAQIPDASRDVHFMSQSALTGAKGRLEFDFIGRFEVFSSDLLAMKKYLYNDDSSETYADFGMHHASHADQWLGDYLSPEAVDRICQLYKNDFILFGYDYDPAKATRPPRLDQDLHRQRLQMLAPGPRRTVSYVAESVMPFSVKILQTVSALRLRD